MPYKIKRYPALQRKPPVTLLDTDSMLFCVEYFCKKGERAKRNFIQILHTFVAEGGCVLFPPSGLVSSLIDANSMAYEACRVMY